MTDTEYREDQRGKLPRLQGKTVDMVAAGYEWVCPNCDRLNHEIEIRALGRPTSSPAPVRAAAR
jgi:hypothetical protein